ncbi:MAG: transglutaminase-like domain-containing protein [Prevotellaceae bacterium]|jgi:regulator of sirC expression with transglutaminase-like and TPR domain|nr:transglutaminase-like domain-containing protein [Prevotellaceae bacterium]
MTHNEVASLISLLDDPDVDVVQPVAQRLLSQGEDILPDLEEAWESCTQPTKAQHLSHIIDAIREDAVANALASWVRSGMHDLLLGAFLVAKLNYPNLLFDQVSKTVNVLCNEIWLELSFRQTPLEQVRIVNYFLFEKYKFGAQKVAVNDIPYFFINRVLDEKAGNPVSLAVLYLCIAQRLDLPVVGINLPRNFIVAYSDVDYQQNNNDSQVLFYINPYNNGSIFGQRQLQQFIESIHLSSNPTFFRPCSNIAALRYLTEVLQISYEMDSKLHMAQKYQRLLDILSTDNKQPS